MKNEREQKKKPRALEGAAWLFLASRARGSNHDRSDVDLAVLGGDVMAFKYDLDEHARTLLMFDVVDLAKPGLSQELLSEIEKDGVRLK